MGFDTKRVQGTYSGLAGSKGSINANPHQRCSYYQPGMSSVWLLLSL